MHRPPEPEEILPDGLRRAVNAAQEAWTDLLFASFRDVDERYAAFLETVIDLAQQTPQDIREEAVSAANGVRHPAVTMGSVVRLADDYDDIRDALQEFFRTFGSFRSEFVNSGSLRTFLWASKEMNEALAECASFYHVPFEAASIDDI